MHSLYRWQQEAKEIFLREKHLLAECATGAGKSEYSINCLKTILDSNPDYVVLVVAPKIVILETVWRNSLYDAGFSPGCIGLYYSEAHEISKITLTTIASIPNLDMNIFDVIIFDEIHNMMTPKLMQLVQHKFKYKLGLSASIEKRDQQHWKLLSYFDYKHYIYTMKEAIIDGIINKFNFTLVGVEIVEPEIREQYDIIDRDYKQVLINNGGFDAINRLPANDPVKVQMLGLLNKRKDLVNNYLRKVDIVCQIMSVYRDNKIILFSQYTKLSRNIYSSLKIDYGIRSEVIDTNISPEFREVFLEQFERDEYNILLSSRIFEEGYNLPKIDTAVFISGDSSSRQLIQRLGRILRKKDFTSEAFYVYCVGTFEEEYALAAKDYVSECAENLVEVIV